MLEKLVKASTEAVKSGMVKIAAGIAALLIGVAFAVPLGLLAGIAVGGLILAAPIAWAYDLIRQRLQRRAPRPN